MSKSPEPRRDRPKSLRKRDPKKRCSKGWKRVYSKGLGTRERSSRSREIKPASKKHHNKRASSHKTEALSKSEGSAGGHWKSRSKKQRSNIKDDDLSRPWLCVETDSFTPRVRYFDLPKRTRMPSHVKTYDISEDSEDHLKIFQAPAKVKHWAMPTWCHMFNSIITGSARVWFDDLPPESVDSYDELKEAFLANFRQQKKCIKNPVEIHHIKQREGGFTEDFVRRFNVESMYVKGASKIMRISGFMHGITNPKLIKCLHDKILKSVDEMMRITTSFLRGRWQLNFKKEGFKNQQSSEWRQDTFTLLSKTPKEVLALEKGKFKTPPPMTPPVEKRNNNKFCEFHGEVGNNSDESMHLKRKIEELLKNEKLSHRVATQRITQSFSPDPEISFPPLEEEEETKGPMIIEVEIGGHFIHQMYVDGGLASEILYKHCFNRLRPEIKNQMVLATAPLIGFSGEIIWPLGSLSLLVKIGDEEHSTSTWMNFMVVRSSSSYNGIIERPGVRKIQAVPSTAHGMLNFPVEGGVFTLRSNKIIPIECATPADMTGVPRHIAEHRLNIREGCPPIRKRRRSQAIDMKQAIQEEVEKLVDAGDFHWTKEAEAMFKQMKQLIAELPTLTTPEEKEELIVYLAAAKEAGQILADFIVERPEEDDPDTATEVEEELLAPWILYTDGPSCADNSEAGLILINLEGAEFTYALRFMFEATNNEAEYKALIAGLRIAKEMGVKNLQENVDSIFGKKLKEKSINELEVLAVVEEEGNIWMTSIYEYLTEETLPAEVNKARAVQRKSQRFAVINEVLYKNSFLRPGYGVSGRPLQANYDLREIHKGSCSMHACTRSVVAKALRIEYYWPTMHKDARALIRACQDCQGINIARPFPKGPASKWISRKSKPKLRRRNQGKARRKKQKMDGRNLPCSLGTSYDDQIYQHGYSFFTNMWYESGYPSRNRHAHAKDLEINLDLLEEKREHAAIREAQSKAKMEKYYNSKVRNTSFKQGDLVYCSNDASRAEEVGKLGPK
nr:reverse transcriptase domain-containing protein [Tanacetum cinerariifolium]